MRLPFLLAAIVSPIASAIFEADIGCTPVQPVNTSSCGVRGDAHIEYVAGEPQIVQSIEECAALCERRVESQSRSQAFSYVENSDYSEHLSWCESFQFDTDTNYCQLSGASIEDYIHKKKQNGRYLFYNSECYDCGNFCHQPYGANLLDNGGFEGKDLGPWFSTLGRIGRGYNSTRSYHCASHTRCLLAQLFNICNGYLYVLEFDYKVDKPSQTDNLTQLFVSMGGHKYECSLATETAHPWTSFRGFFRSARTSPRGTFSYDHEGPSFSFVNGADTYFDNVRAARIPEPVVLRGAQSLFVNGGFDTGQIAPWKVENGNLSAEFEIVSPGIDSQYALRYSSNNSMLQSPPISQVLATKPNTTYLFSFDAQVTRITYALTAILGDRYVSSAQARFVHPGNRSFNILFWARTNNSKFTITMQTTTYNLAIPGAIEIDNLSLVEVEKTPYY